MSTLKLFTKYDDIIYIDMCLLKIRGVVMIDHISNANINTGVNKLNPEIKLAFNPEAKNAAENKTAAGIEKKDINKIDDCETCANRAYQDVSDDGGVSFQSATKLSPSQAASAVSGHEREHYVREQSKAKRENREVISNEISIKTAICPECGSAYVAGGVTRTKTVSKPEVSDKALRKNEVGGINFDAKA